MPTGSLPQAYPVLFLFPKDGDVAQLAEQRPPNPQVAGSNPAVPATSPLHRAEIAY